ncbi:cupin domain-containing protein [Ammoniphilus resinae]|uniref:Oxalate decarboxylase/phosphoglucose isomerase-like protein (Cupin superfamily) n=1 Tax=Ammoniphilus resinae TaxID=861532 RepID=A0ABS4GLY9_9BACL|nr:cupin domain-containing protein [Ammoniphilus resinae]MBP1931292.1 oxalate decarboxylase/phosphoglucose isomerase-like protein (cupin superfamily) [Ammoniphilus resinae]
MALNYSKEELEVILDKHIATFATRKPDWFAFEDTKIEGFRRAQHRFIGAGASANSDVNAIPAGAFTLSIMYVPPGQGAAAHTHEVEEVFFMLQGHCTFFMENEQGERVEKKLGPWDCIWCPPDVLHGFVNDSVEPCYFQTMLGKGRPKAYVAGQ